MRVASMFLASGVRLSVVGLAIGLPIGVAGLRLVLSDGFAIRPDMNVWVMTGGIALTMLLVAAAATWAPAREAARLDPATTLQVE